MKDFTILGHGGHIGNMTRYTKQTFVTPIHGCSSVIWLYRKTYKLQLPLFLLVEEFKNAKTRLVLTLRGSQDELIREAGIQPRTSKKWPESVNKAENSLKHKDIVGVTAVERQGIGETKAVLWSRSDQKRRAFIHSEVRRAEEHARQTRTLEMGAYVEHHRQEASGSMNH